LFFSRSQRQKTFEVDDTQWRLKKNSEAHRGWLLQLLELVLPPSCAAPSHSLPIIALKARGQNQQKFEKGGATFSANWLDCIRATGPSTLGKNVKIGTDI